MGGADRLLEAILEARGDARTGRKSLRKVAQAKTVGELVDFAWRNTDEKEPSSYVMKVMVPPLDPTIGTGERDGKTANVIPSSMACGRMGVGLDECNELCNTQRSMR
jgi:hypothetical protein